MTLSWCVIHDSGWQDDGCFAAEVAGHGDSADCQRVEMVLHPVGTRVVTAEALVVEKVDGEWPSWWLDALWEWVGKLNRNMADALAQSKEGE